MSEQDKEAALAALQTFIESAVESEQPEPAPFKLETELRIDFVMTKIRELLAG
jgi:hypothetical protein